MSQLPKRSFVVLHYLPGKLDLMAKLLPPGGGAINVFLKHGLHFGLEFCAFPRQLGHQASVKVLINSNG